MLLAFQDAQSVSAAQVGARKDNSLLCSDHTNPEASFTTARNMDLERLGEKRRAVRAPPRLARPHCCGIGQ
jgi:hypothetical protein